jgi:hypothetical protein
MIEEATRMRHFGESLLTGVTCGCVRWRAVRYWILSAELS